MKEGTVTVATRITPLMFEEIKKLLPNEYVNISDYLRDLIREDLERRVKE
jgi:Arc/MetJ-type ribon-helix-helix transcriptional regulator